MNTHSLQKFSVIHMTSRKCQVSSLLNKSLEEYNTNHYKLQVSLFNYLVF